MQAVPCTTDCSATYRWYWTHRRPLVSSISFCIPERKWDRSRLFRREIQFARCWKPLPMTSRRPRRCRTSRPIGTVSVSLKIPRGAKTLLNIIGGKLKNCTQCNGKMTNIWATPIRSCRHWFDKLTADWDDRCRRGIFDIKDLAGNSKTRYGRYVFILAWNLMLK